MLDMAALISAVNGNPGRRGQRVLALATKPAELTRSELEQRFLGLVERHGLPRPQVGAPLMGYEADFLWLEQKVVIETDGRGAHATRRAFEADRLRDRRLLRRATGPSA